MVPGEGQERGSLKCEWKWGLEYQIQGISLPISAKLVNPGKAGAVLWIFPRFGALDDHCLHPSTRAFRLK